MFGLMESMGPEGRGPDRFGNQMSGPYCPPRTGGANLAAKGQG